MPVRPCQGLTFVFKETIDHNGVSLLSCPAREPGCLSVDYSCSRIDRHKSAIRKNDLAAIRNSARIDRAMSLTQAQASGAFVLAGEPV